MLGQIPRTPYDLNFSIFRIPVRVHPVFWLTAVWLGWWPGRMDLVVVQVLCIFIAILVHELGHAVTTRWFGWYPEIVLYFLGGYATTARHSTWKGIAVSAAGPAAGFALYAAIRALDLATANGAGRGELLSVAIGHSLFINFVWNVMNLVPVLPLDGGHISREFLCWLSPRRGEEISLQVSIAASGAIALWAAHCYSQGQGLLGLRPGFLLVMFGYLCYQSFQALQNLRRGCW